MLFIYLASKSINIQFDVVEQNVQNQLHVIFNYTFQKKKT